MTTLSSEEHRAPREEARDLAIVAALLGWFEGNKRDLPWRRTRDPYAIWLSEIMLQQTRVETVIPYFERFLARWPTARALATAALDDVLEAWSGLGYYRRARVLHVAAREIVERWGGRLPPDAAGLRELPGVGAYTAGAIASIAYAERVPLVDGNVARVLARLEGYDDLLGSAVLGKKLWHRAGEIVPARAPGAFNESLMELGATICTPRSPRCEACPVAAHCVARATDRVALLPITIAKKKTPVVKMVAFVLERGGRVLLARRADRGLFGGMWEAPMLEAASLKAGLASLGELGLDLDGATAIASGRVRHVLSHKTLDVAVARVSLAGERVTMAPRAPYETARWFDASAPGVGVSTLASRVLRARPRGKAAARKSD